MDYEQIRASYKPDEIRWLFVAESPPPEQVKASTRYFYRSGVGEGDRLFSNTMKALYPEAKMLSEPELEGDKERWLKRFQADGCYLVEALAESLPHGTKTSERKRRLKEALPAIIERLQGLCGRETHIILIKSTVFDVTFTALKEAGLPVINETFVDYPGFWREQQYQAKLSALMEKHGFK